MPDGDRFMRKLIGTGRGWGTAYKLACTDSDQLPAQIMKACADNFRSFSEGIIPGAIDLLTRAFERQSWSDKENLISSTEVFLTLEKDYRKLKATGDYDLIGVLEKTVKSVFNANKNDCVAMNQNLVAEKLGESLALNIVDSRFLSRVRDGVMEKQNRGVAEQIKWEQDLRGKILPAAKRMVKNALKGGKLKTFRAPVNKQAKKSTSDILNQMLRILPPRKF